METKTFIDKYVKQHSWVPGIGKYPGVEIAQDKICKSPRI
jgi:hypothetical protein